MASACAASSYCLIYYYYHQHIVYVIDLYSTYMLTNLQCAREITQCYLPPDRGDSHAVTPGMLPVLVYRPRKYERLS